MRTIDQLSAFLKVLYIIILFGAAIGATIFPVLYAFMVRWWETPMGKYMMYKGIVLAMALDFICVRVFLPRTPVWVSFVLLTTIAVMVWWYLILFVLTYLKGRNEKAKREDRQQEMKEDQHGSVN
jgi:Na+/proline symporter